MRLLSTITVSSLCCAFIMMGCKLKTTDYSKPLEASESNLAMTTFFSEATLNSLTPLPMQLAMPISDVRHGALMRGTAQATTNIEFKLFPSGEFGAIDLLMDVDIFSTTRSTKSGVALNVNGVTSTRVVKRIYLGENGVGTHDVIFRGTKTNTSLQSIEASGVFGGRLKRKIASNQYYKLKASEEAYANRKVERDLGEQFNSQVNPVVKKADETYDATIGRLIKDGRFPGKMKFRTTEDKIFVSVFKNTAEGLTPRPELPSADIGAQTHQSILNEFADLNLSGQTYGAERVKGIIEQIPIDLKFNTKQGAANEVLEARAIFSEKKPLRFEFDDDIVTIMIHASYELKNKDDSQITVGPYYTYIRYQVENKRNGTIELKRTVPFVDDKEVENLAGLDSYKPTWAFALNPLNTMKTMTRKFYEKVFREVIEIKPLPIEHARITQGGGVDGGESNGALVPVVAKLENGWLSMAWRHDPSFEVPLPPKSTCHFGVVGSGSNEHCAYWMPGNANVLDSVKISDESNVNCNEGFIRNDENFNQKKLLMYCPRGALIDRATSSIYTTNRTDD